MDEDESVQDGEDNLEREANEISNKQSSTEAKSDSDSVLCTLSTVIRICNLMPIIYMHSLLYVHIFVQICSTDISYTLLWNNSH